MAEELELMPLPNSKYEQFAQRVARGESPAKAYVAVGYKQSGAGASAARLLRAPAIVRRLRELQGAIADAMLDATIRQVNARVAALEARWQGLRAVVAARAKDPAVQDAPGGRTGLVVQHLRMIGRGESAQLVADYPVDTALLAELRAHEEQAARELGQWAQKHEHAGPDGGPIPVTVERLRMLTDEELAALGAITRKLALAEDGA